MKVSLDELLQLIKNGQISLREASRQSGYSRDYVKKALLEKYGTNDEEIKKIEQLMSDNKASSKLKIDSKLMEDVFLRTMNGEINLEEARVELGGIDIETLKENFLQFIKDNVRNEELLLKYKKYKKYFDSSDIDISKLNFRVLAIKMIRSRISQSELALKLGIPPRTVAREFAKFKDDKDKTLYDILKFYSYKKMNRHDLNEHEGVIIDLCLDIYEKRHPDLLSTDIKSKSEQKLEKIQALVYESERLKKEEGLTQAQIARKLGTSISGLRRARIFLEEHNLLSNNKPEKNTETGREKLK